MTDKNAFTGTTLDGLHNFRDTGGIPLSSGGVIRSGVLFRSDALDALTRRGIEQLAQSPIGVIVDLRTPNERQSAPDKLPTSRPFDVVELSILEGAMTGLAQQFMRGGLSSDAITQAMTQLPNLRELYTGMLTHGAASFAQIARRVAAQTDDAPTAVLVHCTAGKDRTGVATALLLDAAGADRTAVIADYASSQANLAGSWTDRMLATVSALGVPLTRELREIVTGTPPAAMEHALAWVDAHGGSAAYLRSGGLDDTELDALRARLAG